MEVSTIPPAKRLRFVRGTYLSLFLSGSETDQCSAECTIDVHEVMNGIMYILSHTVTVGPDNNPAGATWVFTVSSSVWTNKALQSRTPRSM
jgi:hypothetical protein